MAHDGITRTLTERLLLDRVADRPAGNAGLFFRYPQVAARPEALSGTPDSPTDLRYSPPTARRVHYGTSVQCRSCTLGTLRTRKKPRAEPAVARYNSQRSHFGEDGTITGRITNNRDPKACERPRRSDRRLPHPPRRIGGGGAARSTQPHVGCCGDHIVRGTSDRSTSLEQRSALHGHDVVRDHVVRCRI